MSDAVSWVTLFVLVCYVMGLACLCLAFRIGSAGRNWKRGIREVVVFLSFCALGYGVESWAHARTPYYFYSTAFPDRVARIPFDDMPWFRKHLEPRPTECLKFVRAHMPETREIPLSIPIFEGALAFAALWTARFLGGPVWLRPLFGGLTLVSIDLLIDPIVASTYDCTGASVRQGLGFWRWYIPEPEMAQFYGIPLFNFVGWFAAGVLLVSLANLSRWGRDMGLWAGPKLTRRMTPVDERPPMRGILWLLALAAPELVVRISPSIESPLSPTVQWVVAAGLFGGSAAAVAFHARRFVTAWEQVRELTIAFRLPLLFSAFAFLVSGQFMHQPTFLAVALLLGAVGVLLTWWPYEQAVGHAVRRLLDTDRFVRAHYLAYPWSLALLGAAFAAGSRPTAGQVGALLVVAAAFHIYSCVLNDVVDLDIDRSQVRRRNDPLVRGTVSPTAAHVFALIQIPIMVLAIVVVAPRFAPLLLMAVACLSMGAYNRWGKDCPVPLATDALQGIAWGILALVGAHIAGAPTAVTWVMGAYGACFMFLINGIHGGLRDLANDVACGRMNTARFLGAEPSRRSSYETRSTVRIAAFAFTVQGVMIAMLAWAFATHDFAYHLYPIRPSSTLHRFLTAAVVVLFVAVVGWCHVLLWRLVRPGWARRDDAGSMHAFAILLLPLMVFVPALKPSMQVLVPLCFFVPLLLQFVEPVACALFPALRSPEKKREDGGMSNDLLILVDDRDEPVGSETRAACHSGDGVLHRAFSIYLFDRQGRLLLQKRSAGKQLWPRHWSNSCCSHPRWEENIDVAAARRLQEELGVKANLKEVFTFRYQAHFGSRGSERELCTVYVGIADDVDSFDPTEVAASKYVEPAALDKDLASDPDRYTPWLRLAWTRLRNRHWPAVAAMVLNQQPTVTAEHIVVTNGSGPHEGLVD